MWHGLYLRVTEPDNQGMPAEPARKAEASYDVVYVLPPWAQRRPERRPRLMAFLRRAARSEAVRTFLVEAQFLAVITLVAACLYVVLPDLYRLKSQAGIDLVPGVHAPDVFPFLAGK